MSTSKKKHKTIFWDVRTQRFCTTQSCLFTQCKQRCIVLHWVLFQVLALIFHMLLALWDLACLGKKSPAYSGKQHRLGENTVGHLFRLGAVHVCTILTVHDDWLVGRRKTARGSNYWPFLLCSLVQQIQDDKGHSWRQEKAMWLWNLCFFFFPCSVRKEADESSCCCVLKNGKEQEKGAAWGHLLVPLTFKFILIGAVIFLHKHRVCIYWRLMCLFYKTGTIYAHTMQRRKKKRFSCLWESELVW